MPLMRWRYIESLIAHEPLHATQRAIKGWPVQPQTLKEARSSWFARLSSHIALLLIPIGSIGKCPLMYCWEQALGTDLICRTGYCSLLHPWNGRVRIWECDHASYGCDCYLMADLLRSRACSNVEGGGTVSCRARR